MIRCVRGESDGAGAVVAESVVAEQPVVVAAAVDPAAFPTVGVAAAAVVVDAAGHWSRPLREQRSDTARGRSRWSSRHSGAN